jgi:hypothetical protein
LLISILAGGRGGEQPELTGVILRDVEITGRKSRDESMIKLLLRHGGCKASDLKMATGTDA